MSLITDYIPAPNSGGQYDKNLLVVHVTVSPETEGAARGVIANWNRTRTGSTQYVVDDKEIIQAVPERAYAWAAGTHANKRGIHVELCGYIQTIREWRDGYSTAELDLAARLFAELANKYNIPLRRLTPEQIRRAYDSGRPEDGGFCGHVDITAAWPGDTTHTDPGVNFPWAVFMDLVKKYAAPPKPAPAPAPKVAKTLNVLAWNVKTGNPAAKKTILNLLALRKPDVMVLMECQSMAVDFRDIAAESGYQVFREMVAHGWYHQPMDERGETVVLVAPGVKVSYNKVRSMTERWDGPVHGNQHAGRRYRVMRLKVNGKTWRLCAAHWPTGWSHGKNVAAVQETVKFSQKWVGRGLVSPSVLVGDLNVGAAKLRPVFSKQTVAGTGPDNLIAAKADVTMEQLGRYGSDHHAVLYRLEAQ